MRKIIVSDNTLCQPSSASLSFKEKLDCAKRLDKVKAGYIEVGAVINETSTILVKTICSFLQYSAITVLATSKEQVDSADVATKSAQKRRIQISLPASIVQIEYNLHLKPSKMIEDAAELVSYAKQKFDDVEVSIGDATRSEAKILNKLVEAVIEAGANAVTFTDNAGNMLPNEFMKFVEGLFVDIANLKNVAVYVECSNRFRMALALTLSGVIAGACGVKTELNAKNAADAASLFDTLREIGDNHGIKLELSETDVIKVLKPCNSVKDSFEIKGTQNKETDFNTVGALKRHFEKSGYELSDEDYEKIFETYSNLREKKAVGEKELDVIVATVSKQAPATYKLISFVTNSGNIISSTSHVILEKDSKTYEGLASGDGPIDSAFRAIESIIGHHYELDDFSVSSITEGREAIGEAVVKLRNEGKIYSGVGISTDIIGASIRAYVSALNKIVFEEKS